MKTGKYIFLFALASVFQSSAFAGSLNTQSINVYLRNTTEKYGMGSIVVGSAGTQTLKWIIDPKVVNTYSITLDRGDTTPLQLTGLAGPSLLDAFTGHGDQTVIPCKIVIPNEGTLSVSLTLTQEFGFVKCDALVSTTP